jgi:hypothetical protein
VDEVFGTYNADEVQARPVPARQGGPTPYSSWPVVASCCRKGQPVASAQSLAMSPGLEQWKVTFRLREVMQATVAPPADRGKEFSQADLREAAHFPAGHAQAWSTPVMSEVRKCTPSQTRALMTSSVIVFQLV